MVCVNNVGCKGSVLTIEHNKRVHGGIQTFEYVWKRRRLIREKCVFLFFTLFQDSLSLSLLLLIMTSFDVATSSYLGGHDFSSHSSVPLDPPSHQAYNYSYGDLIYHYSATKPWM